MKVFVSYGTHDRWIAQQIARCIRDVGVETFLDAYDVETGDDVEQRVWESVRSCDELLVLLTPFSTRRGWVWSEIGAARVLGKRVLPILYGLSADDIARDQGGPAVRHLARDLDQIDLTFKEIERRRHGH